MYAVDVGQMEREVGQRLVQEYRESLQELNKMMKSIKSRVPRPAKAGAGKFVAREEGAEWGMGDDSGFMGDDSGFMGMEGWIEEWLMVDG